jgi:hypothetical protein
MMQFSQVDGAMIADKARAALGQLPEELKAIVAGDPELSAKVAALTGGPKGNDAAATAAAAE